MVVRRSTLTTTRLPLDLRRARCTCHDRGQVSNGHIEFIMHQSVIGHCRSTCPIDAEPMGFSANSLKTSSSLRPAPRTHLSKRESDYHPIAFLADSRTILQLALDYTANLSLGARRNVVQERLKCIHKGLRGDPYVGDVVGVVSFGRFMYACTFTERHRKIKPDAFEATFWPHL